MFCFNEFAFTVQVKHKINSIQLLALFWYVCILRLAISTRVLCKECSLFAFLILGSVFSDCVVFYGDTVHLYLSSLRSIDGGPAFSTPVKFGSAFTSPAFPPMRFDPAFTGSAFWTRTICSRVFQSCLFHPRIFHGPTFSIPAFSASPVGNTEMNTDGLATSG